MSHANRPALHREALRRGLAAALAEAEASRRSGERGRVSGSPRGEAPRIRDDRRAPLGVGRVRGTPRRRQPSRRLRTRQSAVARPPNPARELPGCHHDAGDAGRGGIRHCRRPVSRRRPAHRDAAVERARQLAERPHFPAGPLQDSHADRDQHARRCRRVERRAGADGARGPSDLRRNRPPAFDGRHAGVDGGHSEARRPDGVRHAPSWRVPPAPPAHRTRSKS